MNTVSVTIPATWLEGLAINQDDLPQILKLGLEQLRRQVASNTNRAVVQALLSTGRVRHLSTPLMAEVPADVARQAPPTLPGTPVSEIIVAQRRGEL